MSAPGSELWPEHTEPNRLSGVRFSWKITTMCWNFTVTARACGPLLGARLFASVPVTLIVYPPEGVPVVVETVRVELAVRVDAIGIVLGLKEQAGGGVLPPVMLLQESVTVP